MTSRFASPCPAYPTELNDDEMITAIGNMGDKPSGNCSIELYFGFFFDGTGNNMFISREAQDDSETNVARLWAAFDDDVEPSYSGRPHRFASYIEGVGTRCMKKIGDTGIGQHARAGAATGWGGEGRINWALLEFQNHLHAHFHRSQSFSLARGEDTIAMVRQMSADMSMSRADVYELAKAARLSIEQYQNISPGSAKDIELRARLGTLNGLSNMYCVNRTAPNDAGRIDVLAQRNRALTDSLQGFLRNLPKISKIRVSIFGFSRGAAEARVFANWLPDACDPPQPHSATGIRDHGVLRLCGIPVQIDFMGLFDTVAATGIARSMPFDLSDGHGARGRSRDLVIPPNVIRCVHMVAAHESRGSFPLELIDSNQHEEIVYPGMHSDVGGGYQRGAQGRGETDDDKLSQVPLCDMYREAVMAGVPLRLDTRPEAAKQFALSPALREAFNAYISATANASASNATTTALMHAHYAAYLHWRRLRLERGPQWLGLTRSCQRARSTNPQEYQDLIDANDELMEEWKSLETHNSVAQQRENASMPTVAGIGDPGVDFIDMAWSGDKEAIWLDGIRQIWNTLTPLAPGIIRLCDDYVHDSRAGFKPMAYDDDVWRKLREDQRRLALERYDAQRLHLLKQLADARTEPDLQGVQRGGRETYSLWGYLRWRTLFTNPSRPASAQPEISQQAQRLKDRVDSGAAIGVG